ncbi:hypothetical protein PTNB73_07010 [Pyrenophora teres f. teres]|nr:hypothetical protein HRS9139_10554 [Pyrenophora teres f. teres]KAE8821930.1 hypothetical protein HRS9139_10544 [Pyrenophora teres f. teres]KAE8821998.1 hypothetical protein HRS9139_10512 [Pyrenophora teres f. teres]KAE8822033.1 hypothetical protein PTNB85_10561 [Pyrenophora teres f. teres]KAE8822035.1 hypothetical protein HRS9139_10490 [Pyrenophora teres f. teres]
MANVPKLTITPINATGDELPMGLARSVQDTLPATQLALFVELPEDLVPCTAFAARNPSDALRWICSKMPRPKLLKIIQHMYDYPVEAGHVDEDEAGLNTTTSQTRSQAERNPGTATENIAGAKRKREKTTREVNRAMVETLNNALVQTVACSQDWNEVRAPMTLSDEDILYRNFAKSLPKTGIQVVAHMINMAKAVGTMEVFRDWATIFSAWKEADHNKERRRHQSIGEDEVIPETQVQLSQYPTWSESESSTMAGLRTDNLRYIYFRAQRTKADGMAGQMRQRWEMNAFYEEYERLEQEIRRRSEGTGGKGRRYPVVAKELLFASTYETALGRRPTRNDDPALWTKFGEYLDWGKRWNIIKRRFGTVGIFGLLPQSYNPNEWIERKFTQARVSQWVEMVAECNKDALELALKVEGLYLACIHDSTRPTQFEFLDRLDEVREARPIVLLQRCIELDSDHGSDQGSEQCDVENLDINSLCDTEEGTTI